MTEGEAHGWMAVTRLAARPVAPCGLWANPVDSRSYPRIKGRALLDLSTHKRSRLHALTVAPYIAPVCPYI